MSIFVITLFSNSKDKSSLVLEEGRNALIPKLSSLVEADHPSLCQILKNESGIQTGSKDRWLQSQYRLTEASLNCATLRQEPAIRQLEEDFHVEIIFDSFPDDTQSDEATGRPIRLALFDMDSTLIQEEVIDELARSIGKTDVVSAITARAMNGEIDFATSLRERVAMLRGVKTVVWEDLKRIVTITRGARELVSSLKERGAITGVVSGGFMPMAEWLKTELGLDYAFANNLLESPPTPDHPYTHLTGTLSPDHPIVTPKFKRETLLLLAKQHGIPLYRTLAVGDGSNDLLMLHVAGLGIAFNAKQRVQAKAPMRLNGDSLADILCLVGS